MEQYARNLKDERTRIIQQSSNTTSISNTTELSRVAQPITKIDLNDKQADYLYTDSYIVDTSKYIDEPVFVEVQSIKLGTLSQLCINRIQKYFYEAKYGFEEAIEFYEFGFQVRNSTLMKSSLSRIKKTPAEVILNSVRFQQLDDDEISYLLRFYVSDVCKLSDLAQITNSNYFAMLNMSIWVNSNNAISVYLWLLQRVEPLDKLTKICEEVMFQMDLVDLVAKDGWSLIPASIREELLHKRVDLPNKVSSLNQLKIEDDMDAFCEDFDEEEYSEEFCDSEQEDSTDE
jgi:hypothetical protein